MSTTTAAEGASAAFNAAAQARRVADGAARRSSTRIVEVEDMDALRPVAGLLEQVWGRTDEGMPFGSEVLRSLVHAGGAVTCAYDAVTDRLVGAAALVLGTGRSTYSLVAAAAPGAADRGIGYALKLHQRAWALDRGLPVMRWTFDPLVSRNARFNLTKLGAGVEEYVESFYGRMQDRLNGADDSDRLVAAWRLDAATTVAATERTAAEPAEPAEGEVRATGPDGRPAYVVVGDTVWIRVPRDIVELRRADPAQAAAWRRTVRAAFADALGAGLQAGAVTRTGWYRLDAPDEHLQETP